MTTRILCLRPLRRLDQLVEPPARSRSAQARPAAATHEAPPVLEAAERARLADDVEEFSPLIGWVAGRAGRPCLCLDVGPTAHGFGGEAALVERIGQWSLRHGLACGAAVADTLGAAWGVAHFGLRDEPPLRPTRFRSTDRRAPFRRRIVPPGRSAEALAPLDVAALRLAPDLVELLRELGVGIVAPLWALPREALAERFAPELLLRMDQALGAVPELFAAHRPPPTYEAQLAWEEGVADAAAIVGVWRQLLPRLLAPLQRRGRGVSRLLAELTGDSRGLDRFVVGLLRPTLDAEHLLGLLQLRLESLRVRRPIVAARLAVLDDAPLAVQQQVLFADLAPPIESQAWASLVERLAGRLGNDAVVRVRPCADHQPERTWRPVPWLDATGRAQTQPKKALTKPQARARQVAKAAAVEQSPRAQPSRPTLLLARPQPIQVFSIAPQGHPGSFVSERRERRVVASWGPERIETGWWRGPSVRRDYYRVATTEGTRYWLFRDLRSERWFLHGWFD